MSASINDEHFRNTLYSWPEIGIILLFKNFYHRLLAIADIYTRDRHSSEDVVQEVLVDIFRRHKEVGRMRSEPLEKYLVKAVQYRSISHYKKRVRLAEQETQYYYATAEIGREAPAEAPAEEDKQEKLMELIATTFPPRERDSLLLKMEGHSVEEIGRRLGITRKGVERNLTSARKRFKRFGSPFYDLFF